MTFIVFVLNDFTNMILLQFNFDLCNTMASWTGALNQPEGGAGTGGRGRRDSDIRFELDLSFSVLGGKKEGSPSAPSLRPYNSPPPGREASFFG